MRQDELYAALYDQTMTARGSRSPALNNMQSWDPALNPPAPSTVARGGRGAPAGAPPIALAPAIKPPPAPRTVTPAALTRLPANRQGGPPPLPATQGPRFAPKPVVAQSGTTHVGRAGMPAQVLQAGAGRGAAPTLAPVAAVPAKRVAKATVHPLNPLNGNTATAAIPSATALVPAAQNPMDPSGNFRRLTGKGATTALNSDNVGGAAIQGRFLNKDGTRGPQETRAFTQGGIADAGKRLNVVPAGTLFGPSLADDQALSDARFAAAKRGDFEAVERSYMTPEQKQAANVQNAQNKILSAVGRAPLSQLPEVAQAVGGIQAGGAEAALAEQGLQKGALELQGAQQMQSMLSELAALDPGKPESKARAESIIQTVLAAQGKTPTQHKPLGYTGVTDPTGATPGYIVNKDTGQSQPIGGAQGGQPDGVYDMPGIGKVTVRDGIAYDDKGNILQ